MQEILKNVCCNFLGRTTKTKKLLMKLCPVFIHDEEINRDSKTQNTP